MLKEHETRERDGFLDDPIALAIAVFLDRVQRLEKEDRSDLCELSKALICADTEEEEKSAAIAMREILEQSPLKIRRMELPAEPCDDLKKWIEYVSERIKEERDKADMTQDQLAEKSGVPQSHISRLENGQHSPSSKTLEKIAKALGIPVSRFDPSA